MKLRKAGYYARSLHAVFGAVRNRFALLPLLLGRAVCVDAGPGRRLWMSHPLDVLIFKEVCLDDEYRLGDLTDPARIIDVGAGIGEFALQAARRFPDARVVAFEPDPERFDLLARNVAMNRCETIEIHREAIGTRSHPLSCIAWNKIDLLKIDCEGAELDVLNSLSPAQIEGTGRISLEYHDFDGSDRCGSTTTFLASRGFDVEVVPDPYDPRIGHVYATRSYAPGGESVPSVRKT